MSCKSNCDIIINFTKDISALILVTNKLYSVSFKGKNVRTHTHTHTRDILYNQKGTEAISLSTFKL